MVAEDISERPYAEILEEAHPPEGVLPVIGNTLVESVDEPLIDAIVTAYEAGGRVVFLRSLGGAFGRVDAADTAFAHRHAEALVVSAAFLPADATEDQIAGARAVWRTIGDRGVGAYAGFLGSDTAEDIAALWPAEHPGAAARGQAHVGSGEHLPPEPQRRPLTALVGQGVRLVDREPDAQQRAAAVGVEDVDAAAVLLDDAAGDVHAQSAACARAGPPEPAEDPLAHLLGDPGPVVVDLQRDAVGVRRCSARAPA